MLFFQFSDLLFVVLHPFLELDVESRDSHRHLLSHISNFRIVLCFTKRLRLTNQRRVLSPQIFNFILKFFVDLLLFLFQLPVLSFELLNLVFQFKYCGFKILNPFILYLSTCVGLWKRSLNCLVLRLDYVALKIRVLRFSELLVFIFVNEGFEI